MSDNRTTELLRKLLDERGVEYTTNDHMGAYETSWSGFTATQLSPNANLIMAVTPEQAIAATLGGANVDDALALLDEMNERGRIEYSDYSRLHDAIAATLGDDGYRQAAEYWQRMYEELLTERIGEERDYPEHDGRYECPECGNVVYYDELHGGGWTIYVEDYQIPFNCCPNCGKAVKR